MRVFFRRLKTIVGHALRPVPEWGDMWEKIVTFLIIFAPSLASIKERLLSVRTGLLVTAGLAMVATIIAAYRIQKELDEIRDATPKLVAKGISHRDATIHDGRGTVFGTPTFYHLKIANEPTGTVDRKNAENVAARVGLLSMSRKFISSDRLHRWAHAPGPMEAGKSADYFQGLNIGPNGIEYLLDLAMKYDGDEEFYTATNDTATKYLDFRDKEFKFGKGEYIASVRLAGTNVLTTIECRIVNLGKGKKLHIEVLPTKQ
jgi:hypothetical protein